MRIKALLTVTAIVAIAFSMTEMAVAADAAGDIAGVRAADQAWLKAYNSGDLASIVALYDAQATLYPPNSPPIQGSGGIKDYFSKDILESAKAGIVMALDPKPEGGVSGDLGWASGTYTVKAKKGGKIIDHGWYFSVSQRKNGKWVYLRDAFNSSSPPASAPAAAGAAAAKPAAK